MSHFEDFWTIYPRKVGKVKALVSWNKLIQKGTSPEDLVEAAKNYAAARSGEDPTYTQYASTFLGPSGWWQDWVRGMPEGYKKVEKPKEDKYKDFYL